MNRRFVCGVFAAVSLLLAICANAVTTTKNIDIVVTHGNTSSGAVITTHDYYLPATSSAPPGGKVPYIFGQAFRMGDIPSGMYASVTDNSGSALPYQIDSIGPPWPDGSMRHAVYSVMVPATSGNVKGRLQFVLQSGAYSPASTPRSISNITAHNYQIHYQNVMTHPGTAGWSSSPPTSTQPYAWTTKGSHSGNFTCNIDSFISAGQYEIRANGPVRLEAHVYGFMTDDGGGTDPHLYCEDWIDVYSDPSNSANVMYVEQMPLISQPIANPNDGSTVGSTTPSSPDPNADYVIGQASLCDGNSTGSGCIGATKLRDFADDTITLTPADVIAGGGHQTFIPPSGTPPQTRAGYKVHLVSGSLPGGLAEGTIAFANGYTSNFGLRPDLLNHFANEYNIASVGSGSFQLIPLQHAAYYNGFFITQNTNGVAVQQAGTWTPPAGWFPQPDLDGTTNDNTTASQKAYWQQSGLIPGWDLSYNSTIVPGTQIYGPRVSWGDEGSLYTPGSNGLYRTGIDGGGGDYDTSGPWNEPLARWWVRMGTSNWSAAEVVPDWVDALYTTALPQVLMQRAPITATAPPRVVPWDNGPDNAGGSYTGLGASNCGAPTPDQWLASNDSNFHAGCYVFPEAVDSAPNWTFGPFGTGFSNYHWPPTNIIEYLMFGRDYILKGLRGSAQRSVLQQNGRGINDLTLAGGPYYRVMNYCVADAEVITMKWASAILGPASDPEMAYFGHMKTTNEGYFKSVYNNYFTASERAAGACLSGVANGKNTGELGGWNENYANLGFAWAWAASRVHGPDYILKMRATIIAGMFDAPNNSGVGTWGVGASVAGTYWSEYYYFGGWTWPFTGNAPDPRHAWGVGDNSGSMAIATNGVVTFQSGTGWDLFPLQDGDELTPMSYDFSLGTYVGPPELGPPNLAENTTLYLINTSHTTHTFQLTKGCLTFTNGICTSPDPSQIISSITAPTATQIANGYNWTGGCTSLCWFHMRPKHDTGGWLPTAAGEYNLLNRSSLAEFMRTGITADSTYGPSVSQAYSNVAARFPINTWPNCYANQNVTSFTRICISDTVPVYPRWLGRDVLILSRRTPDNGSQSSFVQNTLGSSRA